MSTPGATFMNYSNLVQDVTRYLERGGSLGSDPTVFEQIPRLINACERKIVQILKLQGTLEVLRDPVGLTAGSSVLTKPDRWRETVSIGYGSGANSNVYKQLFPRSYEYCRAYWPDDSVTDPAQPPLFYCDYDYQHWLVVPTPAAVFPLEANCYMQPALLSAANQTNFFTDYTPNMLLYGTLLEATPFIKNDERIPTWQNFWSTEIETLKPQDLQKILDRSAERSRP